MKITDISCPFCGAPLEADSLEEFVTCEHCGKTVFLDDDDEGKENFPFGIDDPEEFGYQFEKGRQRAREEKEMEELGSQWLPTYQPNPYSDYGQSEPTVRPLPPDPQPDTSPPSDGFGCGKLLLWIFFFPIMFWYWFFTTDKLSRTVKWILFLGLLAYAALTK